MNHMSNGRIAGHEQNKNNGNESSEQDGNNKTECSVREQDRFMPIANVIRIMRKILPQQAKISDEAKETIQECVSEYISFVTGEANERCQREQRKTITAEDVLWAMSKLGFDDYIEPLTLYLHRYRELEGDRGSIRTCEPLTKISRVAMDRYAASFGPVFHIAPPPPYYGGPSSANLVASDHLAAATPSTNAAPATGSDNSFDPYALHM